MPGGKNTLQVGLASTGTEHADTPLTVCVRCVRKLSTNETIIEYAPILCWVRDCARNSESKMQFGVKRTPKEHGNWHEEARARLERCIHSDTESTAGGAMALLSQPVRVRASVSAAVRVKLVA